MSSFLKKIFGTIIEKPWEAERAQVDDAHSGQTFDLSDYPGGIQNKKDLSESLLRVLHEFLLNPYNISID